MSTGKNKIKKPSGKSTTAIKAKTISDVFSVFCHIQFLKRQ